MTFIQKLISAATDPLVRLYLKKQPASDPWDRMRFPVPNRFFSPQVLSGFRKYFDGTSIVAVKTLNELCEWLVGCRYVPAQDLFENQKAWEHPLQFERTREGNCLCHALWAWRKLIGLDYNADFLVGELRAKDGTWGGHAWVCFEQQGSTHLLESTAKTLQHMVRPLSDAKADYCPEFGIGRQYEKWAYFGYLYTERRKLWGTDQTRRLTSA